MKGAVGLLWMGEENQNISNLYVGSQYGMRTRSPTQADCASGSGITAKGGYTYNLGYLAGTTGSVLQDCREFYANNADRSKYGGQFARNTSKIQIGNIVQLGGDAVLEGLAPVVLGLRFKELQPALTELLNFSSNGYSNTGILSDADFASYFNKVTFGSIERLEPNVGASAKGFIFRTVGDFSKLSSGECITPLSLNFKQHISTIFVNHFHNAQEIMNDSVGNDNGLCEAGEDCEFAPFIGEHQGKGDYVDSCTINGVAANPTRIFKRAEYGFIP
jgi:hypothetical protein